VWEQRAGGISGASNEIGTWLLTMMCCGSKRKVGGSKTKGGAPRVRGRQIQCGGGCKEGRRGVAGGWCIDW